MGGMRLWRRRVTVVREECGWCGLDLLGEGDLDWGHSF